MPDDAIKAALGVATMLPCREANDRCLCHEAGALNMDTCANELPDVAAAIAAFLEALPVGMRDVPGRVETRDGAAILPHYLAAAVRRAAGVE